MLSEQAPADVVVVHEYHVFDVLGFWGTVYASAATLSWEQGAVVILDRFRAAGVGLETGGLCVPAPFGSPVQPFTLSSELDFQLQEETP